MIRVIIKLGRDQLVEIEGQHSEVEVSMYRIIEEDYIMSIIMEMTLEKTILQKHKITKVKILEVDIEGVIEMTTLEEVEVDLRTDNIQGILVEMTEEAVGLDQVQKSVVI